MPQVQAEQPKERKNPTLPKRPKRREDEYGPCRTQMEIEEGKIYKRYALNPGDKAKAQAAFAAWEELANTQGMPTPVRCPWCKAVRTERPYKAPCDVCGHVREIGEWE